MGLRHWCSNRSKVRRAAMLVLLIVLAPAASAQPGASAPQPGAAAVKTGPANLVTEIAGIVRSSFYSPALLEKLGWESAAARAAEEFSRAPDAATRIGVVRDLLAKLETSHTDYHPRSDPAYWDLASIFEPMLPRMCAKENLPAFPVTVDSIGVFWKQAGKSWFVGGLFAGGPADGAGLKVGDEVVSADGKPFSPVEVFAGRAGKAVALQVRRTRNGPLIAVSVSPQTVRPTEAFKLAAFNSWKVIESNGKHIAYFRIWAWTSSEIQQVVLDLIARSNGSGVDGFIVDIRDGWGGANLNYLGVFFQNVPVLEAIDRSGLARPFDSQIRKPAVILTNGGTRSGKETIAYAAKKHHLAQLVGERTAGAVVFGQPFCLSDGSLMLLAVQEARIDGERLEGCGVEPDIQVPWDFRYAAGKDPQLEKAISILAGS